MHFDNALDFASDIKNFNYLIDAYPQRAPDSFFAQLMGSELHEEYFDIMDRFHYESSRFDCIAAGLSTFRALEESQRVARLSTRRGGTCH